jgi:uncharacterized SAM-binding protein YcdF (DUF218 family)
VSAAASPRSHRWPRWLFGNIAALMLVWLGGLVWFVLSSLSIAPDHTAATDAIVVLTGGRLRLEAGLDLLGAGRAQKLFISGVNPHVDRLALLRVAGRADSNDSRIVLGHEADNTFGNARETAGWMQQEGYRSLRLVTSWYHMRRSLIEFERAMPDVAIVAEPVFPHAESDTWASWLELGSLTVSEYDKYLATLARPAIAAIWPRAIEARAVVASESASASVSHHP